MPHWFEVFLYGCGTLITIAGAVYALPKLFTGLRRIYRGFVAFCRGITRLDKAMPTLVQIGVEFSPNHGTSLKDQITRIDQRVAEHDTVLASQNQDLADIKQMLGERLPAKP